MAGETEAELNKLLEEEEVEELEDLPLEEDDEDAEEHEMVVEAPQQPAPPAGNCPGDEVQVDGGLVDVWYMDDGDMLMLPELVAPFLTAIDAAIGT